ncbi:MAG TPA: hypothetical protein VF529_08605 [Solirubrobacteraceae bacterium]|jgi:hypothetical protein
METSEPEAPTGPSEDDAGHEDVSGGETTPQTGAPDQASEDAESDGD